MPEMKHWCSDDDTIEELQSDLDQAIKERDEYQAEGLRLQNLFEIMSEDFGTATRSMKEKLDGALNELKQVEYFIEERHLWIHFRDKAEKDGEMFKDWWKQAIKEREQALTALEYEKGYRMFWFLECEKMRCYECDQPIHRIEE